MKTLIVAIAVMCAVLPTSAQSRLYTNADLGKKAVAEKPQLTEAQLRGLQARQFVHVPEPTGPRVVSTGSNTADGPFGKFADPIPDRRLDGSLWTDPPWEMRAYVGHGYYGRSYGHGGYGRPAPATTDRQPVTHRRP